MKTFDLIDDPHYESLSISTTNDRPKRGSRLALLRADWAVYYHGRVLHDHLHREEVELVRELYLNNIPASDARWQLLTTPGKQPSPSTDHRREAGL